MEKKSKISSKAFWTWAVILIIVVSFGLFYVTVVKGDILIIDSWAESEEGEEGDSSDEYVESDESVIDESVEQLPEAPAEEISEQTI